MLWVSKWETVRESGVATSDHGVLYDDVLGVYEPIMHVLHGYARPTSRAAEPGVPSAEGQCYRVDCYERLVGEC